METIAVPSNGDRGLSEIVSSRFGRCKNFFFITIEKGEIKTVKIVPNSAKKTESSAGIQATQIIGINNASVLLAGIIGPNAVSALNSLGLKIFKLTDQRLTINEAIDLYLNGKLPEFDGSKKKC